MERSGHSAATALPLQGEEAAAQSLLLGLPAWAFALLGLLAGLLASGAVVLLERNNLQAEVRLQDAQVARRSVTQVERQLDTSGLLLRALQSSFMVDDRIDQQQFAEVHDNLRVKEVLPSMVAVVFARREDPGRPGGRPRYSYESVRPLAGNRSLVGFDMAGQPANLRALQRSRDTDLPVMSAAFPLRQPVSDPSDALGVVVRLPVYSAGPRPLGVEQRRARELGALGISMRVRSLLLAALPADALRNYRVRVLDTTDGADTTLFDSGGSTLSGAQSHGGDVTFGERRWRILMQPRGSGYDASLLWLTAGTGVIASLLLALLLWSAATMRRRAVTLGRQLAQRYRESEERFRTLNDLLPALVLMARADDGCIVYANEAASARLGEDVAGGGTPLESLFEDPSLQHALSAAGDKGRWNNVETTLRTLGNDRFWASTSISLVHLGGMDRLLMVASDTSEQRQLTELLSYQATHDALTGLCNR
ncbi:MAG: CHASE domain-containing protein, partial [Luteimonas sp.]|nr:CHASE domain-containing protein [Luteimonas sp.]